MRFRVERDTSFSPSSLLDNAEIRITWIDATKCFARELHNFSCMVTVFATMILKFMKTRSCKMLQYYV